MSVLPFQLQTKIVSSSFLTQSKAEEYPIWDIQVYDQSWGLGTDGTLVAVIDEYESADIWRNISRLNRAEVKIPINNSKLDYIDLGKRIKIKNRGRIDAEFDGIVINNLDKSRNPVKVQIYNRGFLFGQYKTPWQYQFESDRYDDLIKDELVYEYRFFRRLTRQDFEAGTFLNTATINVASGTIPSEEDVWIMLATTSASPMRFHTNGTYISNTIDLGSDLSGHSDNDLARVRYQAELGETGDIDVRVRHRYPSTSTWSSWSASRSIGLRDEMMNLGITSFSIPATHNEIQIGFHLSSNTVYSGATSYSPALLAFEAVGKYKMLDFEASNIDIDDTSQGETITANLQGHLSVFRNLCNDWGKQWKITDAGNIEATGTIGEDYSDKVLLLEEGNSNIINYRKADDKLVTTVWGFGHGEGLNRLYSSHSADVKDGSVLAFRLGNIVTSASGTESSQTNLRKYGKRIQVWETDAYSLSTLSLWTENRKVKYEEPSYKIRIDVIDIPDTYIEAGDIIRFKSPRLEVDGDHQIINEHRYYNSSGEHLELELQRAIESFPISYISDLEDAETSRKYASGTFWTEWIETTDIDWHQQKVDVGWLGEYGQIEWKVYEEPYGGGGPIETTDEDTDVQIMRYETFGCTIRWRRTTSGTTRIRLKIDWELWSEMRAWRNE